MKIKTLSVLAGVGAPLILTAGAPADFLGIKAVSKPNEFGLIVCNVYAMFDDPGQDLFWKIAGTADSPLLIQVLGGGTFYNHNFASDTAPSSALVAAFPSLAFDTFVTIGIKQTGLVNDALVITPGFPAGITGTQLFTDESGWAVTPIDPQSDPFNPNYVAGNGEVLIAQFATADGTGFSGTMLTGGYSNGQSQQWVVSFFHVPAPGAVALLGVFGLRGRRRRRRRGVTQDVRHELSR